MLRPFFLWLSSVLVFALFYLSQPGSLWNVHQPPATFWRVAENPDIERCLSLYLRASSRTGEALYYSFRTALLKLDWNGAEGRRVPGCLYGVDPGGSAIVPLSVSFVALVQAMLSAALLFMFLLALRNLLKVR